MSEGNVVIKYLVCCNETKVESPQDRQMWVIAPFTKKFVPFLPTQNTFAVCAGVEGIPMGESITIKLVLKDPEDDVLIDSSSDITQPISDEPGISTLTVGVAMKDVVLKHEGEYTVDLFCGEVRSSQKFNVYIQETE